MKVPHGLLFEHLVPSAVLEGSQCFTWWVFGEGRRSRGEDLKVYSLTLLPVSSLPPDCISNVTGCLIFLYHALAAIVDCILELQPKVSLPLPSLMRLQIFGHSDGESDSLT